MSHGTSEQPRRLCGTPAAAFLLPDVYVSQPWLTARVTQYSTVDKGASRAVEDHALVGYKATILTTPATQMRGDRTCTNT